MRLKWFITAVYTIVATILFYLLAHHIDRTAFGSLLCCFIALFAGAYAMVSQVEGKYMFGVLLTLGFLFRLIQVFALPELSDDYFRFVWDGMLSASGESPYAYLPVDVPPGLLEPGLLTRMNSPEYYSVYPALNQSIYWLSVELGKTTYGAVVVMKCLMLTTEVGTVAFLYALVKKWSLPTKLVLYYALNPLVIMEFVGNLHFEGYMVFFLVFAVYLFQKEYLVFGAIAMACAINLKILPVVFVPLLWRRLKFKGSLIVTTVIILVCVVQFIPFYTSNMIAHILASTKLYFGNFEFNSSIYQWIYSIPFHWKPLFTNSLKVVFLVVYGWYYLKIDDRSWQGLFKSIFILFAVYFFLASSVHPWYVTALLPFGLVCGLRFVEIWMLMLPLTYITYRTNNYEQAPVLILLEYLVVFAVVAWEWNSRNWSIKKGPKPFN